jgi:hypothetical protein
MIHNTCNEESHIKKLDLAMVFQPGLLLRIIFIQVPTITNPVGVVGVVGVSEFWTWYRKVEGDSGFSLCAVPSQDFFCLNLQEVKQIDLIQMREISK